VTGVQTCALPIYPFSRQSIVLTVTPREATGLAF
jgi:hypothetical protein